MGGRLAPVLLGELLGKGVGFLGVGGNGADLGNAGEAPDALGERQPRLQISGQNFSQKGSVCSRMQMAMPWPLATR